jgi:signal transduction histidine kinase
MDQLIDTLRASEEDVLQRVFTLARAHGYARYASPLREDWRLSVSGLTEALVAGLQSGTPLDFGVDDDLSQDPITAFGRTEALRHRARGVTLPMFLGLNKYYRDSFAESCAAAVTDVGEQARRRHVLSRLFDRIELGLCDAWASEEARAGSAPLELANRELGAEKSHYLAVLETILDSVFVISVEGAVLFANRPARHLCGQPPGTPPATAIQALNAAPPAWLAPYLHSSGRGSAQVGVPTPEGQRTFLTDLAPILNLAGQTEAVVLVARDVTEYRRVEAQAHSSARLEAVGRLAGGIAHEINTPVQFIGDSLAFMRDTMPGLSTLLGELVAQAGRVPAGPGVDPWWTGLEERLEALDAAFLAEELPKAVARALEGVGRVADLVRAVKEFGHPGTGEMAPADLNRAVKNTLAVSKPSWKFVATASFDAGLVAPVTCHAEQLGQVVLNLVVNAADAIRERGPGAPPGHITVSTRQEGTDAVLEVSDTGMGIAPEHQSRIFQPFFTTKEPGQGTGQGLALAWHIVVKTHGGGLTFHTVPGEGTTFVARVPLAGRRPRAGTTRAPVAA